MICLTSSINVHGPNLQNVGDVVDLLHIRLTSRPESSYSRERRIDNRLFWHVKLEDVDQLTKYTCETMKGTRDVHLVRSMNSSNVDKLMKFFKTYFCCFYVDSNFIACENVPWTKEWEIKVLIPNNTSFVQNVVELTFEEQKWDQYGAYGDYLASCLQLRDNFVVRAKEDNEEGVDFNILMCTKMVLLCRRILLAIGQHSSKHVILWLLVSFIKNGDEVLIVMFCLKPLILHMCM
jgi:hypothetical protein